LDVNWISHYSNTESGMGAFNHFPNLNSVTCSFFDE